jgi:UPF0716 protein FxsA
MLARLLLLFTVVPLVELALLLWLGYETHWTWAVLSVLVTGLAGAWLMQHQGLRTVRRIQQDLSAGRMPGDALQDAALVLAAGVLLLTPGVLTDLAALVLLVPWTRQGVKKLLARWLRARFRLAAGPFPSAPADPYAGPRPPRDRVIDVRVLDPHATSDHPPRNPPDERL